MRLYKPDRKVTYGCLDPLLHTTAEIDLIREQWDQLVRVAASLKRRTAPANVIIQRLANSSPAEGSCQNTDRAGSDCEDDLPPAVCP